MSIQDLAVINGRCTVKLRMILYSTYYIGATRIPKTRLHILQFSNCLLATGFNVGCRKAVYFVLRLQNEQKHPLLFRS